MKLMLHLKEAEREGKTFKRFLFLVLLNAVMPTPALGFISGALASVVALILLRGVLAKVPLVGALIIGFMVVCLAILWQMIYDHYWGKK